MAVAVQEVLEQLHQRYPERFPPAAGLSIPQRVTEDDDWEQLAAYCSEAVKQAGLTRADSALILELVREHLRKHHESDSHR